MLPLLTLNKSLTSICFTVWLLFCSVFCFFLSELSKSERFMCGGSARRKTADMTEKGVKSNHLKGALCHFGEEIQTLY